MPDTATDLTREHYERPEIKEIITQFCLRKDGSWRAMNGDFSRWYRYDGKKARLLNIEDYDYITSHDRVLYSTLNVFEPALWMVGRNKEDITADDPLGTPADTVGYSLAVDIDKGKGFDIHNPEIKAAVEAAAQYLVQRLKDAGVGKSTWVLFSGAGIYIQIHDKICYPISQDPENRMKFYERLTDGFNNFIVLVSEDFFKLHPEHIGKVKFDALNNSKRIFKTPLGIHKKHPYAVTPLDRDHIEINFEKAKLPLKDEVIAETCEWYSTYDLAEREALFTLLDRFYDEKKRYRSGGNFSEIWRSPVKIEADYFPPCVEYILTQEHRREGQTRITGILTTFLYQMGWDEDEAWEIVQAVSDRNGVGNADHIFESCFGKINCPSCSTIQNDANGYPHLGLKGLGVCAEIDECGRWAGDFAVSYSYGDLYEADKARDQQAEGTTVLDACEAILQKEELIEKDKQWDWRTYKPTIIRAIKAHHISEKDEENLHKLLKKIGKTLTALGIEYDDLYPVPRVRKEKKEVFSWRIRAKALKILRKGDPIKYVAESCSRIVIGANTAFRKIICCISAQNVNQTNGLHIKFSGESSGGKTITIYTLTNHLPFEMVLKGSMSSKSGFYHKDGSRILRVLDDYMEGNEDQDTVIKQSSSEFHKPYKHRTVINHIAATLEINSEQTWVITSVLGSQDIQVLNRVLPINVDDSTELTKEVNAKTVERYAKGESQQPIDEPVLVSRAIFQILRDLPLINVRIPFGDRIEWLDVSNRRNPSLFMDLLISITAMNRFQREQDADGYYLATEDDFRTAKALFTDKDAEELVKRLTKRERDVIEILSKSGDGVTRDELAIKMKIAPQRVSQIINGEKGKGGLSQKITITETKKSESTRVVVGEKQTTVYKTVYAIPNPDDFMGFDGVVRLNQNPHHEEPRKEGKHDERNGARKLTDNGESLERKERKKEKERERREESKDNLSLHSDNDPFSLSTAKTPFRPFAASPDSDASPCTVLSSPFRDDDDGEASRKNPFVVCSVCGIDISPGRGSYGGDLCPACGPGMSMVRAAMKTHTGGATVSELWEELSARGRPPRREYLPKMLAKLGCHEEDGKWVAEVGD